MKRAILLSSFVLGNLSILFVSVLFLTIYTTKVSSAENLPVPVVLGLTHPETEIPVVNPFQVDKRSDVQVLVADARPKLIDEFFDKYNSPMSGLGQDIVTAADKYNLPYGILPAIAQCEGNLGKIIPHNSYNSWGWGIYGETMTKFSSWQEAIETVSKGLREDYYNRGLDTPVEIMKRYTPSSNGSWAFCVSKFFEELR